MIKNIIREFFLLTRGEQRGLIAVSCILLLSIIVRISVSHIPVRHSAMDPVHIQEARQVLSEMSDREMYRITSPVPERIAHRERMQLKDFNPNTVTEFELDEMKIPPFPVRNIIKYRNAGGYFTCPEDLLKIYGVDSALFLAMKSHITIPAIPQPERNRQAPVKDYVPLSIELNRADTTELMKLAGIGRVFANRIIRYRDLLGGYVDISQLNEVYGLESFPLGRIDTVITVDVGLVVPINLNLAGFEDLVRHPYLSKIDVNSILQYRDFAKKISTVEELFTNIAMDSLKRERMRFYLTVSD